MGRTIKMPRDPLSGRVHGNNSMTIDTPKARYIWIYTDQGAAAIATQYADAPEVAVITGVSRATAYRIMARLPRYWVSDVRDPDAPCCYSVVKRDDLSRVPIYPKGNPNFRSGVYQQELARRMRRIKR